MSKIINQIPPDNFESVRNRIGEIIADEFANQFTLSGDSIYEAGIWVDRFIPLDKEEMPAVNISVVDGRYDNKDRRAERNTCRYAIDVYADSKSNPAVEGDLLATAAVHRMIRAVRAILSSPHYITLGFSTAFIFTTKVDTFTVVSPSAPDGTHSTMSQIIFEVIMNEYVEQIQPVLAEGYDTEVLVNETDKGYQLILNN